MKVSKTIFFLTCLAVAGCASNFEEEKREILRGEEKRDLIQSFDISKNEVDSTAFQEKEIETSTATATAPVQATKETVAKPIPSVKKEKATNQKTSSEKTKDGKFIFD